MTAAANQVGSVEYIVVLVLENRSFDHMLGFLYADTGNVSPTTKQPFEGLIGKESDSDTTGISLPVSALTVSGPSLLTPPPFVTCSAKSPNNFCSATPTR
jgi:phospholipase C